MATASSSLHPQLSILPRSRPPTASSLPVPPPPPAKLNYRPSPPPLHRRSPNPSPSPVPIPSLPNPNQILHLLRRPRYCPRTPRCYSHILKALALDLQGHKILALKSLDVALSSPQSKTLGPKEKDDALIKRAELSLGVAKRRRRVDQTIEDLTEAMKIGERSGKGLRLLGECYEWKGMIEEAMRVYEEAIDVDGSTDLVRERLKGLREAAKVGS